VQVRCLFVTSVARCRLRGWLLVGVHHGVFDLRFVGGEWLVRVGSEFLGFCVQLIVVVLGAPSTGMREVV
jgi:hypothetical protein